MLWCNNKFYLLAAILGLVLVVGLPTTAYAETSIAIGERTPLFCQGVDDLSNRLLTKTNQFYTSTSPTKFDHDEMLIKRREAFDKKLADLRSRAERDRQRHINSMLARAKTHDQTQAVQLYAEAVKNALDNRQSRVDVAIRTYRNQVDSELARVQAARKANRQQFLDQMSTTIQAAKEDCSNADTAPSSRQDLLKAIELARATTAEDHQLLDSAVGTIHQLRLDSKQQIEAAFTLFRESVEQARQQLVSAVGFLLQ
jgi:hypothetical protein